MQVFILQCICKIWQIHNAYYNPLYPEKYIDYVILSKVKLDHWARDDLYEAYLIDTIKNEPVEAALQRSIATMMDWAQENKMHNGLIILDL